MSSLRIRGLWTCHRGDGILRQGFEGILEPGRDLLAANSDDELADCCVKLLSDDQRRQRLGKVQGLSRSQCRDRLPLTVASRRPLNRHFADSMFVHIRSFWHLH